MCKGKSIRNFAYYLNGTVSRIISKDIEEGTDPIVEEPVKIEVKYATEARLYNERRIREALNEAKEVRLDPRKVYSFSPDRKSC